MGRRGRRHRQSLVLTVSGITTVLGPAGFLAGCAVSPAPAAKVSPAALARAKGEFLSDATPLTLAGFVISSGDSGSAASAPASSATVTPAMRSFWHALEATRWPPALTASMTTLADATKAVIRDLESDSSGTVGRALARSSSDSRTTPADVVTWQSQLEKVLRELRVTTSLQVHTAPH